AKAHRDICAGGEVRIRCTMRPTARRIVMETAFTSPGHWYRGNLHMHSTESDGQLGPQEALTWYRELGYDFASLTDHRKTTDVSTFGDEGFLVIPGTELDCVDPE